MERVMREVGVTVAARVGAPLPVAPAVPDGVEEGHREALAQPEALPLGKLLGDAEDEREGAAVPLLQGEAEVLPAPVPLPRSEGEGGAEGEAGAERVEEALAQSVALAQAHTVPDCEPVCAPLTELLACADDETLAP